MNERNENSEYFQEPLGATGRASNIRRPSVRDSRNYSRSTRQPSGDNNGQARVQVSGTIPASGTDRASMRPAWDQRTSWEQRPSWARQQAASDEPSRQDRHYQLEPQANPIPQQRPTRSGYQNQAPEARQSQADRIGTRPRRSYTQQAMEAWPDSEPIASRPDTRAESRDGYLERSRGDIRPDTRSGNRTDAREDYRGNAQPTARTSDRPQPRLRTQQSRVRIEADEWEDASAEAYDEEQAAGYAQNPARPLLSSFKPRMKRPSFSFQPSMQKGFRSGRPSVVGNVAQAAGEGVSSFVRGTHPAVLLCLLAAAILLVWGLTHFFGGLGHSTYESSTPSYQASTVMNQSAGTVTLQQGSIDPLAKAAEGHKQKQFEERLGDFLVAQREHASNIDLSVRDEYFKLGVSFPSNFEPSDEKVVYLTFDDGPSGVTKEILDILDRYDAKATFFVTNIMPEHQNLIREAYDRGHTIGMHTSTHDYASVYASTDNYFEDLAAISATVEKQIGYVPCFIRFPGGSSNTISANYSDGIMTTLSEMVQYQGYQYYDWNCEDGDARGAMSTQEIIDIALAAEYEAGSTNLLMLLHDANDKQTTAEALPTIIEHYMLAGYRFDALTPDSLVYHQNISN